MTAFSATTTAEAVVPVERARVWDVLVDPDLVARFTPFVSSISAEDEHWIWTLSGLKVLGKGFSATFTERMTLEEGKRIEFTHDPPPGAKERAGVHGWYALSDHDGPEGGVLLETSLEICVDLPLPKLSGGAVRSTMKGVMTQMGDRFSKNLLDHLGVG
ncbi:SRPBCC family protein [Nocardioides sp.]|jgi:carbon monoxide dehydrogenase subunit G|uniref:SRPBCC family protein n=1 Tax=Nocardioides sp. TaxID=35761 RepID=UPI001D7E4D45|nr:SRPBCC family protein [Nocardioides sp.]MBU1802120.1 SRPBCC family protein [Actinomycetota bacterium]